MAANKAPADIYQLKITLMGSKPPIWRRIQVPGSIKLCCLHSAIQTAMGWWDCHLHQFEKNGECWGTDIPDLDELDQLDESKVQLVQLLPFVKDSCVYVYDFGDDWRHKIVVEKIYSSEGLQIKPQCLAGKHKCPREDVGGIYGHYEFLKTISDPNHEDHDRMLEWGGEFENIFDINEVNGILASMKWPVKHNWER